jgi:hypothetical protein
MRTALFYDTGYYTTGFRFGVNLESAPHQFHDVLISGQKSANQNSDILMTVTFTGSESARADSFLFANVTVSLPRNGGDLQITF